MKLLFSLLLLLIISITDSIAQQWQNVSPAGYDYYRNAFFLNSEEGWVVATNGYWANYKLLYTSDGANSFTPIFTFPDNLIVERIQMVDSLNGFVLINAFSGHDTFFWATYDGGYSWIDITDTTLFNLGKPLDYGIGFYFLNKYTGLYGGHNSVYKTTDGGITWFKTNTPAIIDTLFTNGYTVNDMFFSDSLHGWAACTLYSNNGFIMKTIDGGDNWTAFHFITGDLYRVHFSDSLHGGAVGGNWYYSDVILSEDGFDTLSYYYSNNWNQLPNAIYYQNDSTIWMSGYPTVIYKSTNGGASFVEYDTSYAANDPTNWMQGFQFHDNIGYAHSLKLILKLYDTLNTDAGKRQYALQKLKIFPNPTVNCFTIELLSTISGKALVSIYTNQGKLIQTEQIFLTSGKNIVNCDIKSNNPGLYLLKISNDLGEAFAKILKSP